MKKNILLSVILFFTILSFNTSFAQIKFEQGSWAEIKAKAKSENKLIFLDAYTSWCGPCKWMTKNIFTNDTVANYYNSTFINAKLDMEKGEGIDIASLYSIKFYPSLLFIDYDGQIVHRAVGSKKSANFIQLGIDAQNPEQQFRTIHNKYKDGQRDTKFMKTYLTKLNDVGINTDEALNSYLITQSEKDLSNRDNWDIINTYLSDYNSKEFNYILKNQSNFSKNFTLDSVNQFIYYVFMNQCQNLIYSEDSTSNNYSLFKEEIKKSEFTKSDELILESDIIYFLYKKDYNNYAQVALNYVEKYQKNNADVLNNNAYNFYKYVTDKEMLNKAERWAKKAYKLSPAPDLTMDTYASLLFLNNKKKKAIKLEQEALDIIKKDSKMYDPSTITLIENKISEWNKK